jgi:methylphosphotriester-DNA--protein-cysteine methyltransferase
MTLTKDEVKALRAYFDNTTINITKLIRDMGLSKTKKFESVIDKIYK